MSASAPLRSSTHASHLARHLDHLSKTHGREELDALLERAAMHWDGSRLTSGNGGEVGSAECARYLEAVREVLGDSVYMPARVNFILARCSCLTG